MGKGSNGPQETTSTVTQNNLPEYAEPYVTDLMARAQAESNRTYTPYEGQRMAPLTAQQQSVNTEVAGLQDPAALGQAAKAASAATKYKSANFNEQTVNAPDLYNYNLSNQPIYSAPMMDAAQTGYNPALQQYLLQGPQEFGQGQADQYMTPYMQSVVDVQKREAMTDAQKSQLVQDLGAARQGTYGGARQLLAGTERERALGQQLGDIQAKGLQSAYENAQQQFERDRAARMGVSGQNLQSLLQTQELGTTTGLQTALANLTSRQQADVQNMQSYLQTQGLNADQAMRAALANQQGQLGVQELGSRQGLEALLANQQANMEAQRLSEQSKQFGAQQGLAGAQALGQIGATQAGTTQARLQAQSAAAAQEQAQQQQALDIAYADFLRQQDYPMEQLGYYSSLIRGLPMTPSSTATTYAQPPSTGSQIAGAGLGALSLAKLAA